MCKELKILFVTSHSYHLHHKKKQMTLLIDTDSKAETEYDCDEPKPKRRAGNKYSKCGTTNIHAPVKSTFNLLSLSL